jgi:hypothetical protein
VININANKHPHRSNNLDGNSIYLSRLRANEFILQRRAKGKNKHIHSLILVALDNHGHAVD